VKNSFSAFKKNGFKFIVFLATMVVKTWSLLMSRHVREQKLRILASIFRGGSELSTTGSLAIAVR